MCVWIFRDEEGQITIKGLECLLAFNLAKGQLSGTLSALQTLCGKLFAKERLLFILLLRLPFIVCLFVCLFVCILYFQTGSF